jgi:hypothetical protein
MSDALVAWRFGSIPDGSFDPPWIDARFGTDLWRSKVVMVPPSRGMILSWNADMPSWSGMSVRASVRLNSEWTDWTPIGESGTVYPAPHPPGPIHRDADTVSWDGSADAVRLSVRRTANHNAELPEFHRIVISLQPCDPPGPVISEAPDATGFIQDVPFRSQMNEEPAVAERICGPTSLGMALESIGTDLPTRLLATHAYDAQRDLYGNWAHLAAVAGANGAVAWVQRFTSLREVEERLLGGYAAILSIAYEQGDLTGSPIPRTSGHLVVLRGWTASGDPICNDPRFDSTAGDGVVYQRSEFERCWLDHDGAAILLRLV